MCCGLLFSLHHHHVNVSLCVLSWTKYECGPLVVQCDFSHCVFFPPLSFPSHLFPLINSSFPCKPQVLWITTNSYHHKNNVSSFTFCLPCIIHLLVIPPCLHFFSGPWKKINRSTDTGETNTVKIIMNCCHFLLDGFCMEVLHFSWWTNLSLILFFHSILTHTMLTCVCVCVHTCERAHRIDLGLHEEKKVLYQQAHHIDMSELIPL